MKYRNEIDGLRALAVVPVILFHADFKLFSGGFVGVDVFFVISGYLITTILIEDIENNRFSLFNFYERRARRILPALFFVMFLCIPFAWMWMIPSQMKDFSQSLVAVSLFASNVLFWKKSTYFDEAAEESPLLHTWSLAVEEQFYVLFPIFLFLAWRYGKNRVFWVIIVMALVSFLLSEWSWRNKPTANFYLATTRAWELFAGSITSFVVQKRGVQKNDALALFGLACIVISIFVYDETTPFPSAYALVPVLGTMLFILFADKDTFAAKLLSTKAFVSVGLISYSAYLWHQPLFAFAKLRLYEKPPAYLMIMLSIASILLAVASWKFIEKPFRHKSEFSKNTIFALSLTGIVVFGIVGISGHFQNGFDYRLSVNQREILEWEKYPREIPYREGYCFLRSDQTHFEFSSECIANESRILIWGDSHAAALASGWKHTGPIHQLTASGCPPILRSQFTSRPNCLGINQYIEKFILDSNYETIILHANWLDYGHAKINRLAETIISLQNIGIKNVVVVGGFPRYSPSLPQKILAQHKPFSEVEYVTSSQKNVSEYDRKLEYITSKLGAKFLRVLPEFCRNDECLAVIMNNNKPIPVAWDYAHLTEFGAIYLANRLAQNITK